MDRGWTSPTSVPPPTRRPLYGEQAPAVPPPRRRGGGGARRALVIGAVAGGLAVAALLGLSLRDGSPGGAPLSPIAEAAQKTSSLQGVRFSGTGTATGAGLRMTMSFRGAYNAEADRASMRMAAQVPAAPQIAAMVNPLVVVQDGLTSYIASPAFAGELPAGKAWLKLDGSELVDEPSGAAGNLDSMDPRTVLAELELVSDDVRRVGREQVRGVVAVHYAATLDPALQAAQLREEGSDLAAELVEKQGRASTVDVWVDRKGLVRRTSMVVPFELIGGPGASMSMTMDFHGFGATPTIDVPSDAAAFDVTELGRETLEQALEQL